MKKSICDLIKSPNFEKKVTAEKWQPTVCHIAQYQESRKVNNPKKWIKNNFINTFFSFLHFCKCQNSDKLYLQHICENHMMMLFIDITEDYNDTTKYFYNERSKK